MRNRGRMLSLAVAVTAAAAFTTAGAAANATVGAGAAGPTNLQSVLLPASQQPAGTTLTKQAITTQQAVADRVLEPPAGMTFAPDSCVHYLDKVIGKLDSHAGWVQYGTRAGGGAFVHAVIPVSGGADLQRIRAEALTCRDGTVTQDSKVTGTVSFAEVAAPALPGASTFGFDASVAYPEATCGVEEIFVASIGEVLVQVAEPTPALATQMIRTLYDRVMAAATG